MNQKNGLHDMNFCTFFDYHSHQLNVFKWLKVYVGTKRNRLKDGKMIVFKIMIVKVVIILVTC